jgi:hypothetical protein
MSEPTILSIVVVNNLPFRWIGALPFTSLIGIQICAGSRQDDIAWN